ncbi:MAG TPA: hypothetical protein VJJ52_04630 [Candidatus Nanoarchaeia archaeon]|nr:hypothetical protein [Candidatus Nanoarchaeia archaeon]
MEEEHDCCKNKKIENGMKNYLLVGMVVLVFLVSVFQSFQINLLKGSVANNQVTGNAVSGVDMSGWTDDEKMMYEHHGVLPSGSPSGSNPSGSGMVGGC